MMEEPRRSLKILFSSFSVNLKTVPSSSKRRPAGDEVGGEGGGEGGDEGEGGSIGEGGATGGGGPCGGNGGGEGEIIWFARVSVDRS